MFLLFVCSLFRQVIFSHSLSNALYNWPYFFHSLKVIYFSYLSSNRSQMKFLKDVLTKLIGVFVLGAILIGLSPVTANAAVHVNGYYRKNGTYVRPHYRSDPDSSVTNNWSYPGNTNPYTGVTAGGSSYTYTNSYTPSPSYTYTAPPTPTCPIFSSYDTTSASCKCYSGYVVSGSSCVNANTYCYSNLGYGSHYDGASKSCSCDTGYILDSSGKCSTGLSVCMAKYGSRSSFDSSDNTCFCDPGSVWNESKTSCVLKSSTCSSDSVFSTVKNRCVLLDEICTDNYGQNSFSDGSKTSTGSTMCYCKKGFAWNGDRTSCATKLVTDVSKTSSADIQATDRQNLCTLILGPNAIFDSVAGDCSCRTGFSKQGTACEPISYTLSGSPKTQNDLLNCSYVGNTLNKLYYKKGHKIIKQMSFEGKTCFSTEAEAKAGGYEPGK